MSKIVSLVYSDRFSLEYWNVSFSVHSFISLGLLEQNTNFCSIENLVPGFSLLQKKISDLSFTDLLVFPVCKKRYSLKIEKILSIISPFFTSSCCLVRIKERCTFLGANI